jgi:hypothetical protein
MLAAGRAELPNPPPRRKIPLPASLFMCGGGGSPRKARARVATQSVKIALRGRRPDRAVGHAEFFAPLRLPESDPYEKPAAEAGAGDAAMVVFAELRLPDYYGSSDPWGALEQDVAERLEEVAAWLRQRPREAFEQLRGGGIRTDLVVQMSVDAGRTELSFPPSLSAACGGLGIIIVIVTNG